MWWVRYFSGKWSFSNSGLLVCECLWSLFDSAHRHVFIALFYGTIYFQLKGGTDPSAYTNRLSIMFFSMLSIVVGLQATIPVLIEERLVFYRERGSRAYGALPYWISSWCIQVPLIAVNTLTYCVLLYYLCGLDNSSGKFVFFFFVLLLCSYIGLFACQLIAAIAPNATTAVSFFPVLLFFSVAFSGYIVYIPQFPIFLRAWAPYLSFIRYAFQALVLNEFQDNPELPFQQLYVDSLGFDTLSKWECVPALLAFLGFYAACVFLALKFINFEER
jgi:ABC-type multidrug transport system permease subunit